MNIGLFIKQFISFFIQPFGLIFVFFMIGLYFLYKNKYFKAKIFISFSFFILLLFSYHPFSNFLVKNLEDHYAKYSYAKSVGYIHVLGSGHNDDESQPISSKIGGSGLKRVLEGVILYKNMPNTKIIFTGAKSGASVSTAMMNAKLAIALGVNKEDIIIDETAEDTADEADFAKQTVGDKAFVLVTSATHMPRAMQTFHLQGLHPMAAPTDFRRSRVKTFFRLPNLGALVSSQVAMHEYFGILFLKIKNIL